MRCSFVDHLSREISITYPPQRIISLVPSQTELLFDLGLDDHIIGVTKFCIYPAKKVKNRAKVGGTKKLNIGLIDELHPDLIIANKEENELEQIQLLMQKFPVWVSDIANLADAIQMINDVGQLTNTVTKASAITSDIQNAFSTLSPIKKAFSVAYLIWQEPFMIAAKHTYIDDMLTRCGFANAFEQNRYPVVTHEDLIDANPDIVMLSSEPYPFKQKHVNLFQTILPQAKVILVDGEMFSWYGSRLLLAVDYFKQLIDNVSITRF